MNNDPIGILDSGVGGLTIWKEIAKDLPQESTIYIGDSLNSPYGGKNKEEICELARKMFRFLIEKKVKLIVVACNTVTVACLQDLRNKFKIPVIGTVPVIKTAVERTKNKRIGILSTTNTANSQYQKDLINKFAKGCEVINVGTNRLVPLIEKGDLESLEIEEVLREEMRPFVENQVDVLALGCTHFPFLKMKMQRILGDGVEILDSGGAIARQVGRVLENENSLGKGEASYSFYTTGSLERFKAILSKVLDIKKEVVEKVEL